MANLQQKILNLQTETNARLKELQFRIDNISYDKIILDGKADELRKELSVLGDIIIKLQEEDVVKPPEAEAKEEPIEEVAAPQPEPETPEIEPPDETTGELTNKIYDYFEELGYKSNGMGFTVSCERIRGRLLQTHSPMPPYEQIKACVNRLKGEGWLKLQSVQNDENSFIIQMLER